MVVKLCINDVKTGKSYNKELKETEIDAFLNKRVNSKIEGHFFGFSGYEFQITGGSDDAGFPMRFDVEGTGRKRVLLTRGPGVKINIKGMRKRKAVKGNTINNAINQINLKTLKYGSKSIAENLGVEEKTAEEKEAKVTEEKKE